MLSYKISDTIKCNVRTKLTMWQHKVIIRWLWCNKARVVPYGTNISRVLFLYAYVFATYYWTTWRHHFSLHIYLSTCVWIFLTISKLCCNEGQIICSFINLSSILAFVIRKNVFRDFFLQSVNNELGMDPGATKKLVENSNLLKRQKYVLSQYFSGWEGIRIVDLGKIKAYFQNPSLTRVFH